MSRDALLLLSRRSRQLLSWNVERPHLEQRSDALPTTFRSRSEISGTCSSLETVSVVQRACSQPITQAQSIHDIGGWLASWIACREQRAGIGLWAVNTRPENVKIAG